MRPKGRFDGHEGSRVMSICANVLLISAALGLVATPAFAVTPNPTPSLRTGDYQAQWGLLAVGNPTVYGRNNVSANIHPTTVHYDAASGTYVFNDGQQNISFARS